MNAWLLTHVESGCYRVKLHQVFINESLCVLIVTGFHQLQLATNQIRQTKSLKNVFLDFTNDDFKKLQTRNP